MNTPLALPVPDAHNLFSSELKRNESAPFTDGAIFRNRWALMSLLIVEDEPRVASLLTKGLMASGYLVKHVTTGIEALDCASQPGLELVVLDLGLPDIDGLEVLKLMREAGNHVPVVILTARTDPQDRARAFSLGADDFISKPFSFADFVARVGACVSGSRSAQSP